jgi:hypothetical protein
MKVDLPGPKLNLPNCMICGHLLIVTRLEGYDSYEPLSNGNWGWIHHQWVECQCSNDHCLRPSRLTRLLQAPAPFQY